MAAVTGEQVLVFLGLGGPSAHSTAQAEGPNEVILTQAETHCRIVTELARAYTRGRGFDGPDPNDEVAAVIVMAVARLMANPEQIKTDVGTVSFGGGFYGWNLAELKVLNRYRVRAQ